MESLTANVTLVCYLIPTIFVTQDLAFTVSDIISNNILLIIT